MGQREEVLSTSGSQEFIIQSSSRKYVFNRTSAIDGYNYLSLFCGRLIFFKSRIGVLLEIRIRRIMRNEECEKFQDHSVTRRLHNTRCWRWYSPSYYTGLFSKILLSLSLSSIALTLRHCYWSPCPRRNFNPFEINTQ